MPTPEAHGKHIERSKRLLAILQKKQVLPEWVIIAAFLNALHCIEALFACLPAPRQHCENHEAREKQLKTDNRFKQVYKQYRPLKSWSLRARYLDPVHIARDPADDASFAAIWAAAIDHRLVKLKKSAAGLVQKRYRALFT